MRLFFVAFFIAYNISMLCGCVERKMNITSDPPKAQVWLDGKSVGTTPAQVPFSFYGTREITLAYPGYEVYTILETIEAPVYQYFPLDFVYEFLLPMNYSDEHTLSYTLKPYLPLTEQQKQNLQDNGRILGSQVENTLEESKLPTTPADENK